MSVDNMIPELWSARLERAWARGNVWAQVCRDLSMYMDRDGDTLHLGEITSDVTIFDYTVNTDMSDPQTLTTSDDKLTMTEQKGFSIFLDDIDRRQTRPELVDEAMRLAAIGFEQKENDFLKGKHSASSSSPDHVTEITGYAGGNSGNNRYKLVNGLLEVWERMSKASAPTMGRYCVVGPNIARGLIASQRDVGLDIESGTEAVRAGHLVNEWGFEILIDPGISSTSPQKMYCGIKGEGIVYARQIRQMEGLRHQKRFGDILRGLAVYGAYTLDDEKMFQITVAT